MNLSNNSNNSSKGFPSKSAFYEITSKYNLVPISISFISDLETPISTFLKLKAEYLLESVEKGDSVGRYTIIAKGKKIKLTFSQQKINVEYYSTSDSDKSNKLTRQESFSQANPLDYLNDWMSKHNSPTLEDLPPYFGGWLGYLGHESIAYFEPSVSVYEKDSEQDQLGIPDGIFIFPELVCVFDNVLKKTWLIKVVAVADLKKIAKSSSNDWQKVCEEYYENELSDLLQIKKQLEAPLEYKLPSCSQEESKSMLGELHAGLTSSEYQTLVKRAKEYIEEGEVIQVVLSNRFTMESKLPPFEIYRTLKSENPSPYLFYLDFEEFKFIGSSPEVMVKLEGETISLKPIAGTRKRGKDLAEDKALEKELLQDEKELAEHIMLVDLGRNDLSRVAKPGSVAVEQYMSIEKYSRVQHIVSTVNAIKKENVSATDLVKATFPAGTLSGAPKIRAMQLIHDLEGSRRGPYGGLVGFLSLNGDFNSCITIRTILEKNNKLFVQAGAGIVQDSIPLKEAEECEHKAAALIKAIEHTVDRLVE